MGRFGAPFHKEIMKIKALKTLVGNYGLLDEGMVADLPNWQAGPLLALGYVEKFTEVGDGRHEDTQTPGGELHRGGNRRSKSGSRART